MALPRRPPVDAESSNGSARDALLVERVLGGDAAAYGELVERHMRRAFSIAFRILEHREDSEDVVQDSFLRALDRIDTLQAGRPFHSWFYRIVVNQALNYRRARSVRTTQQLPEQLAATTSSPVHDAENAALGRRLRAALDTLPERQRTIVQLADLEELNSREIAEILDLPAGTVRWHLHEARRTLRDALGALKGDT
jgi:RNA polymerase sigma-70 factor, ECF subfamily